MNVVCGKGPLADSDEWLGLNDEIVCERCLEEQHIEADAEDD